MRLIQVVAQQVLDEDRSRVAVVLHLLSQELLEIVVVLAEDAVVFLRQHFQDTVVLRSRVGGSLGVQEDADFAEDGAQLELEVLVLDHALARIVDVDLNDALREEVNAVTLRSTVDQNVLGLAKTR